MRFATETQRHRGIFAALTGRRYSGRLHSPSHAGAVLAPMGKEEKLTVMFSEEVVEGEGNRIEKIVKKGRKMTFFDAKKGINAEALRTQRDLRFEI